MISVHIHWLIPCEFKNISEVHQINLASIRLRAGVVVQSIENRTESISLGETVPGSSEVCVVGKIGGLDTANKHMNWIRQLREFKGKIILDFTDDHLNYVSGMTAFYMECLELADVVVCSSESLQRVVSHFFSGPIHVIADAIECPILPPKTQIHQPLTLLWFGHATNIKALADFIPQIQSPEPLRIIVVSNQQGLQLLGASPIQVQCPIEIQGRIWTQETTVEASKESDICIIPAELQSTRKSGVSANRLLTAIALGLPTCADKIDSYLPFKPYYADLRTAEFNDMLSDPGYWNMHIQSAQEYILPKYSKKSVGEEWLSIFDGI